MCERYLFQDIFVIYEKLPQCLFYSPEAIAF